MKKTIVTVLVALYALLCRSQERGFELNRPCPEIIFKDLKDNGQKEVSVESLKGKWIILDFFSSSCTVCFKSLPKINALQKKYKDRLSFILVGNEDGKIKTVFQKYRYRFDLKLITVFDSTLFKRFGISVVPYYVWVDEQGIVRFISSPADVNEENINSFLRERPLKTEAVTKKTPFDPAKLFMIDGNGSPDSDFLYRSIFSKWKPTMQRNLPPSIDFEECPGSFQVLGVDIATLYNYAYFGKGEWTSKDQLYANVFPYPIFKNIDSSFFHADYKKGRNAYCYSLWLPSTNHETYTFQRNMQNDLENYFGLSVAVVVQKMPCWKLVATSEAKMKLKTKGGVQKKEFSFGGFSYNNIPVDELINELWTRFQQYPPFVDATGIKGAIDIDVDAVLTDFDDFREGLRRTGLDLVLSEKEMRVLVIEKPSSPVTVSSVHN